MQTTEPTQEERQEASAPTTPAERLALLANTHRSLGPLIVQNPNTPLPLILELAIEHPDEFLRNPALSLFLVERPDFIEDASEELLETLLAMNDDRVLAMLQNHSQYWVRTDAFLSAPNPPRELIEQYSRDTNPSIRAIAARHNASPLDILRALSGDPSESVRAVLALRHDLTEELTEKLLRDESPQVRLSFLHHKPMTEELLSRLLADPAAQIRDSVILRDELPEALLKEVLLHPNPTTRQKLFERGAPLPDFVLSALCQEKDPTLLKLLCQKSELKATHIEAISQHRALHSLLSLHPNTSASVLSSIYQEYQAWSAFRFVWKRLTSQRDVIQHQASQEIRKNIAMHPNTPEGVIEAMAQSAEDELLPLVAQHPKVSVKALERLARYPYAEAQRVVAMNPKTSPESLRYLSKQTEHNIVSAVAQNPNTPVDVLQRLATHDYYLVPLAVAKNPSATTEILTLLIGSVGAYSSILNHRNRPEALCQLTERVQKRERLSEEELRQAIHIGQHQAELACLHPDMTPRLWREMSQHKNDWYRHGVAVHSTSPELLQRLFNDPSLLVTLGLLSNPVLPEDLLERFSISSEAVIRERVASHPKATKAILRGLASDPDPKVQRLAQKALSL